ncbi:hypothetical protein TNCV_1514391 [Trichonephila clavipes]|nr:hypothetical protein TNCV_1514391 [Trichonephila clavipes]
MDSRMDLKYHMINKRVYIRSRTRRKTLTEGGTDRLLNQLQHNRHGYSYKYSLSQSEAIQSGDARRTFGQCVPRVVALHCAEIWLLPSPEYKEGQQALTPRRCSAGCLKYRQCILEECESDIQHRLIP